MNPLANLFKITPIFNEELDSLNQSVLQSLARCKLQAPPWEFGGLVTPEIRGIYECFIPIDFLLKRFRKLAQLTFKESTNMPLLLNPSATTRGFSCPDSFPDFLNTLPEYIQPCFPLTAEKFILLMFHFADPWHYGTTSKRYPKQLQIFRQILAHFDKSASLQILDVGCGTGQGTYEIAQVVGDTMHHAELTGMTLEPLEVLMAQCRYTPHRPAVFPICDLNHATCAFQIGNIMANPQFDRQYDFIFCNGLFGGPAMSTFDAMNLTLEILLNTLKINGYLLMANHFHQGYLNQISRFLKHLNSTQITLLHKEPSLIVIRKNGALS